MLLWFFGFSGNIASSVCPEPVVVRIFGFSGVFATNGWPARQVCKKWMEKRTILQAMGGQPLFLRVNPSITCKLVRNLRKPK